MPDLKSLLQRLLALVQRYPGTIAAFGFASGIVSFFTVERHEAFARVIAIVMLLCWAWLVVEQWLRQRMKQRLGWTIPTPVLRYATQMIHQEGLFFVLPFLYAATTWNSGQVVFTGLLGAAALVALVDPLYFRWLAGRRWVFLTYHTFTMFAVLLTAFPLILHLTTGLSYRLALGVAVALSFPSLAELLSIEARWRKWAVVGLMAALGALGWFARLWVPPATLRLNEMAISTQMDTRTMAAGKSLRTVTPAQLQANGIYAYTAVSAPLGLREHIYHVWLHNGREVDRIALDIRGGRKEGYRAWTHKRNFTADPQGRWQVKVVTDAGQMIGTLRFRVEDRASPENAAPAAPTPEPAP
ncbi:hypothetical protein PIGHUM_00815 [Pigmentiphaga humi]|uniref:DUF2914 domain-containing protein n=1 Tax=Pigmentiphaga humi TaxID=2478468 RepID=A0A3P4AXL4_9BURK|nr:DUF5924 family protein [Pigmentiphaga humi]VCU68757.1 hypothetical protein PIGHUM_00815 [Pigmentiphaga humi]